MSDLEVENEDGITILFYLQKIYPDEWKNFKERIGCKKDSEILSDGENVLQLQRWASHRGQRLSRTVRGMMYYRRALKLQAFLDMATESEILEGYKAVKYSGEEDKKSQCSLATIPLCSHNCMSPLAFTLLRDVENLLGLITHRIGHTLWPNRLLDDFLVPSCHCEYCKYEQIYRLNRLEEYDSVIKFGKITKAYVETQYLQVSLAKYDGYAMHGGTKHFGGFGFVFPQSSPLSDDFSKAIMINFKQDLYVLYVLILAVLYVFI